MAEMIGFKPATPVSNVMPPAHPHAIAIVLATEAVVRP